MTAIHYANRPVNDLFDSSNFTTNVDTHQIAYSISTKGEPVTIVQKEQPANILLVTQEALKNLWHLKKYLDLYISMLEGTLSEDEFGDEAHEFVVEKRRLKDSEISFSVYYIKKLLPDIDVDDIAELLNVDFVQLAKFIEETK